MPPAPIFSSRRYGPNCVPSAIAIGASSLSALPCQ
jgi:hypothetical protein